MNPKSRVIAFIGVDGVGKSTQINLLRMKLTSKGIRTKTAFIRSNHLFSFITVRALLALGLGTYVYSPDGQKFYILKPNIQDRLITLLFYLDVLSILLLTLTRVYVPMWIGKVVLLEGCLLDSLTDYIYFSTKYKNLKLEKVLSLFKLILKFIPSETQIIWLDAKDETLKERWRRRGTAYQYLDYVNLQRRMNTIYAKYYNISYISTDLLSVADVHMRISDIVGINA